MDALAMPLIDEIQKLQEYKAENQIENIKQNQINEYLLKRIVGYLQLIGDFLKKLKDLSAAEFNPFVPLFPNIWNFI